MSPRPPLLYPAVRLKQGRDQSVRRGHLWIFSGGVAGVEPAGREDGSPVVILSNSGEPLGVGHYFNSSIAVKILSRTVEKLDAAFWQRRIEAAIALRADLGLGRSVETSGYRLVNGEGDRCPGLIIDRYDQAFVLQLQTAGTLRAEAEIVSALKAAAAGAGLLTGDPKIVVRHKGSGGEKGAEAAEGGGAEEENAEETTSEAALAAIPEAEPEIGEVRFKENGLIYAADLLGGQKTGFFLDQRDNRLILRLIAKDKRVLNLFCYSGAFSVSAFAGGAAAVVSVDSSKGAIALCLRNIELNSFSQNHTAVCEDCFTFLEQHRELYQVIVVDPPAFVKHAKALRRGLAGYEAINALALRNVQPGGEILTFSCSQLVSPADFYECISRAAVKAGREVQILRHLSAAPCHPAVLGHPEGEYLKGLLLRVS